jgi:hypothetical protein
METHARVVGALHVALGGLFALAAAAISALGLMTAREQGGLTLPAGATGALLLTPFVLMAALHLLAGFGFLRFKRWARSLVFALSLLALLNVPLGTGVGLYSFWVLYHTRHW